MQLLGTLKYFCLLVSCYLPT